MPNKELNRSQNQGTEVKAVPVVQNATPSKTGTGALVAKTGVAKTTKDSAMSPGAAPAAHASSELLGSLTTEQQQRTSARVIKKLRTEPAPDPDKRDTPECDTPSKIDEKDPLKFPTVKQRMPKALWSADEKSLFFEGLNEYGKDFDAITTHICAKMKKKGMPDMNLKTKTQVSHFYYRTWHKLSKHVHFGEDVKKVVQEQYALINYGELRKKLVAVSEKTCARLHEMVMNGTMMVRLRGKNVRVRTPMCRALRRLNQITERSMLVGVSLAGVVLRARTAGAWARVVAAAHNPRAALALSPRVALAALLRALEKRWQGRVKKRCKVKLENIETEPEDAEPPRVEETEDDLEEHLNLDTDRIIVQEQKLAKKPVLHVGPRPTAAVRLPVVRASEQLSSQKICFSSYLQRMYSPGDKEDTKIRTPKRHRKDSSEKDKELEQKRPRLETEPKLDIDETAVDGIELMANYKTHQEDEEKPSTEDEKETKAEETAEEEGERDKYMSEREKDSFSEMEDDEKYIKSDSDNESDKDKGEKKTKFKNLKVKFRIRPMKRGGAIYTLVNEKEGDEPKVEEPKDEEPSDMDVDSAIKQIRKGWSMYDAGDLTLGDLYLMFGSRSKLDLDYWWAEPAPPQRARTPPRDRRADRTPDKLADKLADKLDSSLEEERRESDSDMFSPKASASGHDSNDGSGDERKPEHLVSSPERKPSLSCLNLASKLVNRPAPAPPSDGLGQMSERLKRLLALAGNPHVGGALARCACGHVCSLRKQQSKPPLPHPEPLFRHPTPIAPKPSNEAPLSMSLAGVPRWRRGRPRAADRRVVVQRLLPLLPKLPPPSSLIPVKMSPNSNSPPAPARILPKPPPTSANDLSVYYVLSELNGQFFLHDGDRRVPISLDDNYEEEEIQDESYDTKEDMKEFKIDISSTDVEKRVASKSEGERSVEPSVAPSVEPSESSQASEMDKKPGTADIANFPSESMSLSPSRLLAGDGWLAGAPRDADGWLAAPGRDADGWLAAPGRDADGWLAGAHDFSLSSFLGQLEPAPELAVDSHLQSLMAESSVDYVAKFADLAAEVSDERPPLT